MMNIQIQLSTQWDQDYCYTKFTTIDAKAKICKEAQH